MKKIKRKPAKTGLLISKFQACYFVDIAKLILKFIQKSKRSGRANKFLKEKKEKKNHRTVLPKPQTLLQYYSYQDSMVVVKKKIDTEIPEINFIQIQSTEFDKNKN